MTQLKSAFTVEWDECGGYDAWGSAFKIPDLPLDGETLDLVLDLNEGQDTWDRDPTKHPEAESLMRAVLRAVEKWYNDV